MTPEELKGKIITAQKKIKQKKRCLHYDSGENCNHFNAGDVAWFS